MWRTMVDGQATNITLLAAFQDNSRQICSDHGIQDGGESLLTSQAQSNACHSLITGGRGAAMFREIQRFGLFNSAAGTCHEEGINVSTLPGKPIDRQPPKKCFSFPPCLSLSISFSFSENKRGLLQRTLRSRSSSIFIHLVEGKKGSINCCVPIDSSTLFERRRSKLIAINLRSTQRNVRYVRDGVFGRTVAEFHGGASFGPSRLSEVYPLERQQQTLPGCLEIRPSGMSGSRGCRRAPVCDQVAQTVCEVLLRYVDSLYSLQYDPPL